jgi:hypothetical protein
MQFIATLSPRVSRVTTAFALVLLIVLGSVAAAYATSPSVLPVEPDGGIGWGSDLPLPVEPDGGIGN